MGDHHLIEQKVSGESVFQGNFLNVFRDVVKLPSENITTREYVVHPGAVMVIPLLEDAQGNIQLVLERQFRYPMGQVMVEFPAGKLDAGEPTFVCAQRELFEETGYSAAQWARAGVLHPVISYSTEFIEIWFARGLTLGERQLDADEFLDVFTVSPTEFFEWCREGRVTDAKTLTGALWLQNFLSGGWSLDWQNA
jgi:ADP-ribose pyrophosphatase